MPDQDCNLVTYSASNQVSFATQTTVILDNYAVTPPCRLAISGTGGGFIALIDSFASGDQSDTVLFTRPLVGDGTMTEGQILPQVLAARFLWMPWRITPPHVRALGCRHRASCVHVFGWQTRPAMRLHGI